MATPIQSLQRLAMPSITSSNRSCKVAVIGAGAAGLVAARELRREGHKVVVFERDDRIGGTWVYNSNVESDPLGLDPSRTVVHTSLYESLRTNLPREAMGFRDYPFVVKGGIDRDSRRFPGHREVFHYLEDFVYEFQLTELIRFETQVLHVGLVEEGKWVVKYRRKDRNDREHDLIDEDEVYDGVVVCNGHYTEPRIAEIPGIDAWPGKQIHSHNYRVPDPFKDQVVLLVGSSASAVDISRDIAKVSKEVHIASRSFMDGTTKQPGYDNMWLHSMIENALDDGTVVFQDGSSILADVILHCTGYKYHFPFLKAGNVVTVDDNRVGPLYKHIFPPLLASSLSFIGLPWKVVPFALFELQGKWVAGVLSGRIPLPSPEEMMGDVEAFYKKLESAGIPKRYTHNMSDSQFEYNDWLAAECGYPVYEEWRKEMYYMSAKNRVAKPERYRDDWEDQHLVLQAQEDFLRYLSGCD